MKKIKIIFQKYKIFIISLLIVFLFGLLFPYTGDDWQWGSWPLSINTLERLFQDPGINGRFFANVITLIITKNIIFRAFLLSFVLNFLVEIIYKSTKVSRIIIWSIFLLMPKDMFRQVIPWASGFVNYTLSILFLILCLIVLKKGNYKFSFLNILLFFVTSLFVENITVFLLIFTLGLNIFYLYKNKKFNLSFIYAFLGSFFGSILMFSQPAYKRLLNGSDGYRTLTGSFGEIIKRAGTNFKTTIDLYIGLENIFLILFIVLSLYFLYLKLKKKNKKIEFLFYYMFCYMFYILFLKLEPNWLILGSHTLLFNSLITILFTLSIVIILIYIFYKNEDYSTIITLIITISGLIAPLMVILPIGARNFAIIYYFEMVILFIIIKNLNLNLTKVKPILIVLLLVITGYYLSIYGYIFKVNQERTKYIKNSLIKEEQLIIVPYLPYQDYLWVPDFNDEYNANYYKEFSKIDNNVKFEFRDYNYWYNYIYREEK